MTKATNRIEAAEVERYTAHLKDKSRPPSRGGNTRAWHRHVMTVGGETYSFLAAWSGKFVHSGERATFDWAWDDTGTYRNVVAESVVAIRKDGSELVRGERGGKKWRTADARPPGRRSEWER